MLVLRTEGRERLTCFKVSCSSLLGFRWGPVGMRSTGIWPLTARRLSGVLRVPA